MALRERSVGFDLTLETINGAALEAQGRKTAQHVIVRFVSLSDIHRSNARLKVDNQRLAGEHETLLGLLEALSTNRGNGIAAMARKIRELAALQRAA